MKKIFSNTRLTAIAFFTVLLAASAPAAYAIDSSYVVPVELKFIGSINQQPLFQLSLAGNVQQDEFTIIVRDEEGNSLYREYSKGENFSKKFLVSNDQPGDTRLRFEITSKKSKKTVVYEIDRHTRFLEPVIVNELK